MGTIEVRFPLFYFQKIYDIFQGFIMFHKNICVNGPIKTLCGSDPAIIQFIFLTLPLIFIMRYLQKQERTAKFYNNNFYNNCLPYKQVQNKTNLKRKVA